MYRGKNEPPGWRVNLIWNTAIRHGTGLLDKAMEAIRGTAAIEEAYRDAKLEVTIQGVGLGLGVAGVVGSAPYSIEQDAPSQKFYWSIVGGEINAFVLVLLMGIGAGVAVWLLVLPIAKFKRLLKIGSQLRARSSRPPSKRNCEL